MSPTRVRRSSECVCLRERLSVSPAVECVSVFGSE